ncbi:secreted RxLR effector protein 161-like [Nicotiana sylvestris]|uniref:secreted RxLR effector protein 161-like n=1 Tax=Nicotiana sylvestris TaxID=4096 RepID=UPI00388CA064
MDESKEIDTPIATATKLDIDKPGLSVDQKLYRGMIGSLLYLTANRPDMVFSVGLCARFQANPKESHLTVVKRILRYLKGTTDLCLWCPKSSNFNLVGHADYTSFLVDKKSTSDMNHFLGSYFGIEVGCIPIFCDNTSVISMTKNLVHHKRNKHIDVVTPPFYLHPQGHKGVFPIKG